MSRIAAGPVPAAVRPSSTSDPSDGHHRIIPENRPSRPARGMSQARLSALQEVTQERKNPLMGVFDEVVAGILKAVHDCLWKPADPLLQKPRREAKIPHTPTHKHRPIPEPW